jgi:hypothetical protein
MSDLGSSGEGGVGGELSPVWKFQSFIFNRELAEVYLLLDHLSGRPDKDLIGDAKTSPLGQGDGKNPIDWIREVANIVWPPTGADKDQAAQAATLIKVRDYLNRQAAPATGATIAFTLLVAGEGRSDRGIHWRWPSPPRKPAATSASAAKAAAEAPAKTEEPPPSRLDLAETAFPMLGRSADRFWAWNWFLSIFMLIWLVGTCLLSWDIAQGNSLLSQYTAAQSDLAKVEAQIYDPSNGAGAATPAGAAATAKPEVAVVPDCKQPAALPGSPSPSQTISALSQSQICAEQDAKIKALAVAGGNLKNWTNGWVWLHCLPNPLTILVECRTASADANNEPWTASLLSVLTGGVLPICYGVLGAAAAVVRSLSAKMRESLLAPRDLQLSLIQLALGAVIGACIGLFVSPSGTTAGASTAATSGLLGTLGLSTSALCFIAGFFVEGVFVALEALMRRVFDVADPTKKVDPAR